MKKNKKMSLMNLFESDIFQKNLALKSLADQELPGYVQNFAKQIKEDKYQEAIMTLNKVIETAQRIQQEMQKTLQTQQQPNQQPQQTNISNSEV
jgi:hypothetical protein